MCHVCQSHRSNSIQTIRTKLKLANLNILLYRKKESPEPSSKKNAVNIYYIKCFRDKARTLTICFAAEECS